MPHIRVAGMARGGGPGVASGGHACAVYARCPSAGLALAAIAAAVPAFTVNLALQLAPVRVNLIAAGFADTPLSPSLLGDDLDSRRDPAPRHPPIRRVAVPDDVAALAGHS